VPLDAPIVAFRGQVHLQINVQPTLISHINDVVIHFRTAKDDGVIFTTWNGHNDDYMKAYLQDGHVHLDTFIERSGREVHSLLLAVPKFGVGFGYGAETGDIFSFGYGRNHEAWF